jgi:hypothetical protein
MLHPNAFALGWLLTILKPLNMSQGIVKVTPKPGAMGTLAVTIADPNPWRVIPGALLQFPDPKFAVQVNDTVECTINSATTCAVTRVIIPVPTKTGSPVQAGTE